MAPLTTKPYIHYLFVGLKCIFCLFSLDIVLPCVCFLCVIICLDICQSSSGASSCQASFIICFFVCSLCLLVSFHYVFFCLFFNPFLFLSSVCLFVNPALEPPAAVICFFCLFIVLACFFPLRACLFVF